MLKWRRDDGNQSSTTNKMLMKLAQRVISITNLIRIYTMTLHGTMKIKSPRMPSRAGKDLISHFRSLGVASLRYLRFGSLTRAS